MPKSNQNSRAKDRFVQGLIGETKRWVIQGAVFVQFTGVIPSQAITHWLASRFPKLAAKKIIAVTTNNGRKSYFIYDEDEFEAKGDWCFTHPAYVRKAHRQWQTDARVFYQEVRKLEQSDLAHDTLRSFKRFYRIYLDEYSIPLATEYYSLGGDKFIRALKLKHSSYKRLERDIITFTKPPKPSFLQQYELALISLARIFTRRRLPTTLGAFRKSNPAAYAELERIREQYFWIRFDYRDTNPLSLDVFYSELGAAASKGSRALKQRRDELANYERRLIREQAGARRHSRLTGNEIRILKSIGFAGHWQDERKRANLIANYWCQRFISQFARQLRYSVSEIWHLTPRELFAAYRGKRVSIVELRRRKQISVSYDLKNGREGIGSDSNHLEVWKRIQAQNLPMRANALTGIAASPGTYQGTARIIETPNQQGRRLRHGDVLVTYMTRPDFVPLMQRAGAIVTDEGGLTSHAAIIARELKIPCVVGTRFAMRVLKDGDRVEVDAVKGIVRKV